MDDDQHDGAVEKKMEQPAKDQVAVFRTVIAATDEYMVALKAVHRWEDAVTPIEKNRISRLRRRDIGGSETPDLVLANRKLREARATLEGTPASIGVTGYVRASLLQAIQGAQEALGELRLVAAELDPVLFDSASLKLCLANDKVSAAITAVRQVLQDMSQEAEAADLEALRGPSLDLHASYLRAKGCR